MEPTGLQALIETFGGDAISSALVLWIVWSKLQKHEEVAIDNASRLSRIETLMEERAKQHVS